MAISILGMSAFCGQNQSKTYFERRTNHQRSILAAQKEMESAFQKSITTIRSETTSMNFFLTEKRGTWTFDVRSVSLEKFLSAQMRYFAAGNQPPRKHDYQSAKPLMKTINFDRKPPRVAANDNSNVSNVDQQCEVRRTWTARFKSFVEDPFWNTSRPRELAKMLSSNGLFLLSRRDQFAIVLSARTRTEQVVEVGDDYELLPAPKRLKVRCAFCKRVFEVSFTASFNLFGFDESSNVAALHFDADSHYSTLCAIANDVKLQHERRSPSCPMVVGINSDDDRFGRLSDLELQAVSYQLKVDPFYERASSNCQKAQETSISLQSSDSGFSSSSVKSTPAEMDATLSESPVTKELENSLLFTCYKKLPCSSYSDAAFLCIDDNVQFGSWCEYELNGRMQLGDPLKVYGKFEQPVTPTLYDEFPEELYDSLLKPADSQTDEKHCEDHNVELGKNCTHGHEIINRCDDEVQCGYESIFERLSKTQARYAAFTCPESRKETFETGLQFDYRRLSIRSYLALYEDDLRKSNNEEQSIVKELRLRIGDVDWPLRRNRQAEVLADAGFFSLRRAERNVCVCFWCGMALADWHPQADAFVEHARHLDSVDSCAFLYFRRGRQFILDAQANFPVENARTKRVDLLTLSELQDTEADQRFCRLLSLPVHTTAFGDKMLCEATTDCVEQQQQQQLEETYDPLVSFFHGVSYRVEEREVRARKDLRLVRNLIYLCGAQPLTLSFAMEQQLKTTMTDYVNTRQFLEALWDIDARMRSHGDHSDIVRFQQQFNESLKSKGQPNSSEKCGSIEKGVASAAASDTCSVSTKTSGFCSLSSESNSAAPAKSDPVEPEVSDKLCLICRKNPADILVMPCNHLVVCGSCFEGKEPRRCPNTSCRKVIKDKLRLYY